MKLVAASLVSSERSELEDMVAKNVTGSGKKGQFRTHNDFSV